MHKIFLSFLLALSAFCVATLFTAETDNDAAGGNPRMSVVATLSDLPADVHSSEVPAILSFHYFFDRIAEFHEIDLKFDKNLKRQVCGKVVSLDIQKLTGKNVFHSLSFVPSTMLSTVFRI